MTAPHDEMAATGPSDLLAASEQTLVEALGQLARQGFLGDFVLEPDDIPPGVRCETCHHRHLPSRIRVVAVHRFEGPSSPEDEALLLALVCPRCGARGTVVTGYGPTAVADEAELLAALATRVGDGIPR